MTINILDKNIADKIAAGEVIERPVSIVKELVENSIDANASQITIEIKNGGKSFIRITDNGDGIPQDEVSIAFYRHATGKISSLDDLNNIHTLGFRGEALTSIAAISRLTILTKTNDEILGTKLILHAGKEIYHDSIGINKGTSIIVQDIFYNTPARRKFMKSDGAEAAAIIDFLEKIALYYSNIKFRLINNGRDIFSTAGDSNLKNTIENIYPFKDYKDMIKVDFHDYLSNISINGYISDPMSTKKTRKSQITFVNGRIVSSKIIDKGIDNGYGDRVFKSFPVTILFINISAGLIDINIHPSKKEIKFINENDIINVLSKAISSSMKAEKSIPKISIYDKKVNEKEEGKTLDYQLDIKNYLKEKRKVSLRDEGRKDLEELKEDINIFYKQEEVIDNINNIDNINDDNNNIDNIIQIKKDLNNSLNSLDFNDLKIAGYIFKTYIITNAGDNLYIIDQHAAHERINYERLVEAYNKKTQSPQSILTPFSIEVSSSIYEREDIWSKILKKLGFDFDDFGDRTFIFRGIPKYMNIEEARLFVQTFIDELDEEFLNRYENLNFLNSSVIDKLIMKSCKKSVKGGDKLSIMEMQELIDDMSKCDNPFSCPHGRPTMIKINKNDVEKIFKRK